MKHPYAEILLAIADGEEVEWQSRDGEWMTQHANVVFFDIANGSFPPERYRIKPPTVNINGIEVPEPLRSAPEKGQLYYAPNLCARTLVSILIWQECSFDFQMLKSGFIHLTEEAAKAHAKAMLGID